MTGQQRPDGLAVLFTPRATRELLDATRWWRANRHEAPRLLDDEVQRALQRIAAFPKIGLRVQARDVRVVVLRRSAYLLFYRVRPRLRRIEVISVWHGRRDARPRR